MLKVEVRDASVESRELQGRNGKPITFREQTGYLHGIGAYPVEVRLSYWRDAVPLGKGIYDVGPECFSVSRYGKVEVDLARAKPGKGA